MQRRQGLHPAASLLLNYSYKFIISNHYYKFFITPKGTLPYVKCPLWVPNHLQDAKGDLAPRSFLKCYACAAQTMLKPENERILSQLPQNALLSPTSIQGAVQEVSADRVEELKEDFPWIVNLKGVLKGGTLWMPFTDFQARLMEFLKTNAADGIPANSVDDLVKLLLSLGIITKGSDGQINMPEIYLHGFGLKRKSGKVVKPNTAHF